MKKQIKNQNKRDIFDTDDIFRLFIKLAIPAIIGLVVMAIYNMVDRIFIGQAPELGMMGLAAANAAFPIMLATNAVGLLIANGGAILFSIFLGKNNREEAGNFQRTAFIMSVAAGLFIMIFGNIFMNQILKIMGGGPEVSKFTQQYLSIILYGTPFACISMFGNNFSRAQGNPNNAMVSMLIGAGFNIVFDYIFIMHMNMGMRGAAIATIGGQFLSAAWQLKFLFSDRSLIRLRIDRLGIKFADFKRVVSTGMPVFVVQIAGSVALSALNANAFAQAGDLGLSVISVVGALQMLVQMPVVGFIQAQLPIISYNYGAKNLPRIKKTLLYSILSSTFVLIVTAAFIQIFPEGFIRMFNQDAQLIKAAVPAIRTAFLMIPIIGLQAMLSSLFQATEHVFLSALLHTLRQIVVFVPLIYIMANIHGIRGVFMAIPIADTAALVITLVFAFGLIKKLRRVLA